MADRKPIVITASGASEELSNTDKIIRALYPEMIGLGTDQTTYMLPNIGDLNDLNKRSGFYYFNSSIDSGTPPAGLTSGYILVLNTTAFDVACQYQFFIRNMNLDYSLTIHRRWRQGPTFSSSWFEMYEASNTPISAFMKTVLDDPDAATVLTTIGAQPLDATLSALANLTTAANEIAYATGVNTFAMTGFTDFARSLVDDANAAAALATLGVAIDVDDSGWNAATLVNSWTRHASWATIAYRKISNFCILRGVVQNALANNNTAAFTLAAGYRPPVVWNQATNAGGFLVANGIVSISTAGAVNCVDVAGASTVFVNLHGIIFPVA